VCSRKHKSKPDFRFKLEESGPAGHFQSNHRVNERYFVANAASSSAIEPFVTAKEAARFLCCSPITVNRLACQRRIPAHSLSNGVRKRWRFLISELATALKNDVSSQRSSAPLSRKKGQAA
jgi:hypothetical protein